MVQQDAEISQAIHGLYMAYTGGVGEVKPKIRRYPRYLVVALAVGTRRREVMQSMWPAPPYRLSIFSRRNSQLAFPFLPFSFSFSFSFFWGVPDRVLSHPFSSGRLHTSNL